MIPSFFIAHGSPLLAIEDNEYTQYLRQLGDLLTKPKAIVVFSAHWVSPAQRISDVDQYKMIYDFYGFPEEMYHIEYPARGEKSVADEIEGLLKKEKIHYAIETHRGLDHGAWVVLRLLYQNADIPVVSMSVAPNLTPGEQYRLGKLLSTLGRKDILVLGSGGTVHNLRAVRFDNETTIDQWALEFDQWLEKHLITWDLDSLFKYSTLAPNAGMAVPHNSTEHFIPIFYAMGAADHSQKAKLLHRSYRYGNLSHSIWQFG